MLKAVAVIVNSRGLHARPASRLAKLAAEFKSKISIGNGRRRADATSITELLMLIAPKNTELRISANGADEKQAITAMLELIAGGFEDGGDSPAVAENPPAAQPPCARLMQKINGIGVAKGKISGKAEIHRVGESEVPRYAIAKNKIAAEQRRLERAARDAQKELARIRHKTAAIAAEVLPFIDLYRQLLADPALIFDIRAAIAEQQCNAEWAIKQRADAVGGRFLSIEDAYLRERGDDMRYVIGRLLSALKPAAAQTSAVGGLIAVAAELDPAHVIVLKERGYAAFVAESGGYTSHTAILARSLGMPAVVGAKGILAAVGNGDDLILDMDNGTIIVRPDAQSLLSADIVAPPPVRKTIKSRRGITTKDGEIIALQANIEFPDEARSIANTPAIGVGLFRTEFLFMNRKKPPTEDEQFEAYRSVLREIAPMPVVARTLDFGQDKTADGMGDFNPLGQRAIRYCLAHPKVFLTQLRALLRAAAECRNLKILLPMLSHPAELEQTAALINHAREQLRAARKSVAPIPPLGGMIEVPAAVFVMRALSRHLDFFSIGTNDLIQYTLAADRGDERLARYYQQPHPAIAHLLAAIVDNAARVQKPVTLCGEMAGNPEMTRFLLALGLRSFSMAATQIAAVRDIIADVQCAPLVARRRKILAAATPAALQTLIADINDE